MRFLHADDDKRLTRMVAEGAVVRETLEKAVGDRAVVLIEALVEHREKIPSDPWIAWGVRQGLARVNGVRVTQAFIRDLGLDRDALNALAKAWVMPFARNTYGQVLVACAPGYKTDPGLQASLGEAPIMCAATLSELDDLQAAYRDAAR